MTWSSSKACFWLSFTDLKTERDTEKVNKDNISNSASIEPVHRLAAFLEQCTMKLRKQILLSEENKIRKSYRMVSAMDSMKLEQPPFPQFQRNWTLGDNRPDNKIKKTPCSLKVDFFARLPRWSKVASRLKIVSWNIFPERGKWRRASTWSTNGFPKEAQRLRVL